MEKFIDRLQNTIILVALVIVILAGGAYLYLTFASTGVLGNVPGQTNDSFTLTGSATRLNLMPNEYVAAAATTTNLIADGGIINQEVFTENVSNVRFLIAGRGLTATSTLYIKQQISYDDSTYYDAFHATGTSATSTVLVRVVKEIDLGLATTTASFDMSIVAAPHSRFLLLSDDAAGDPNDGVKAAVQAILVKNSY